MLRIELMIYPDVARAWCRCTKHDQSFARTSIMPLYRSVACRCNSVHNYLLFRYRSDDTGDGC
jgi:hypothetical protein